MNFQLPHPRKQNSRIVRIHPHIRAARVFIHKQHLLPALPSIRRAEHAAFWLRAICVPERTCQHDLRIARVNDDVSNAPRFLQPHQRPGLAHTTFASLAATASEPIEETGCESKIGSQWMPASVVLKIPPEAAPT